MASDLTYRILYILDGHTSVAPSQDDPSIRVDRIGVSLLDSGDTVGWRLVKEADFIFLLTHGSVSCFRGLNRLFDELASRQVLFVFSNMEDEVAELLPRLKVNQADYLTIQRYIKCFDADNATRLHRFVASRFGGLSLDYEPARYPRWQGIYGQEEEDEQVYVRQLLDAKTRGISVIGVIVPFYLCRSHNLLHVDSLLSCIETLGAKVLPIFTTGSEDPVTGEQGLSVALEKYFLHDGVPIPDSIINLMPYSMGVFEQAGPIWAREDDKTGIIERLNLPILQAYTTYHSAEEYRKNVEGLDAIALISSVCYPEFDGQIDGYPIGTRELADDGLPYYAPFAEGIETVAKLAFRWALLRRKPNEEKRIAIIFHNMPPRNDSIGCAAGLDSPQSVYNVVEILRKEGIYLPDRYKDGDEIIGRIIDAVTNDTGWLEDKEVLARAVDSIPTSLYLRWHDLLTQEVQTRLTKSWDKAPGTFKVIDDQMPVPGIINGNVFIGLQPPRGYEEHAEEIYHSTDVVCPHYYIALYRWIRHVFEADVFIHVGTHGSLEWLPGKEKGLSRSCFPLVNAEDMPHLYIYHTAIIGEGIQAKRRSAAVLLNHMEPAMTEGGTYGDLTDFDALVSKYLTSNITPAQKASLRSEILQQVVTLNLDKDIGYSEDQEAGEELFVRLHNWLGTLKGSMVRDGLHIFGQVPEAERLESSIRMLLRLPHGKIPSLLDGLARYYGYSEDVLRDTPEHIVSEGMTASMMIDHLTALSRQVITSMLASGFVHAPDEAELTHILGRCTGEADSLRAVLQLAISEVYPRLMRATDELANLYLGTQAGFVPPGKGGSPCRGALDILPTGRNMYAIDPNEIPSHTAYAIGMNLGAQLLERQLEDTGKYPDSIAIVLYSGDQMRTYGEDIGEILWLMGLRPQWLSDTSDKVVGLEVIPLSELGRPRIDVVSRISGLLRDTFPNIITLIDEAVRMVVALDESHEDNYVKKHYDEELTQLLEDGIDPETARQEAAIRVFGCPPGTYGGGVNVLVETKQWQNSDDLGTAAITWGGHAYTQGLHGAVRREAFERRLSKVEATVKNQNIIGFDLYDIDDEYIYHGGIIAAVKKCSGRTPQSYYGNTSDPSRSIVRTVMEESARVMRSRLLNPIWIEGLKRHGYRGAYDIAYNMDNIFGWDATADTVLDWNYEALAEHFVGNPDNRDWMREVNPWALQEVAEKLLEAAQRGMWNAKPETIDMLTEVFLDCEGLLEEGGRRSTKE